VLKVIITIIAIILAVPQSFIMNTFGLFFWHQGR